MSKKKFNFEPNSNILGFSRNFEILLHLKKKVSFIMKVFAKLNPYTNECARKNWAKISERRNYKFLLWDVEELSLLKTIYVSDISDLRQDFEYKKNKIVE